MYICASGFFVIKGIVNTQSYPIFPLNEQE